MCGVLGWIDPALNDREAAMQMADAAMTSLRKRGPDDERLEFGSGWLLGHTRLAIVDLSRRSAQPMTVGQGVWLVYNGQIYNFRELREELQSEGCTFESSGDAEVLLQAMRHWGVACLERLRGMFAFALVDVERRELILARDRYGVKPLAYELNGAGIRFASDLRALQSLPGASREVDSEAAYLYIAMGYVPAPHTIHKRVRKVRPGHFVRVRWTENGVEGLREVAYLSPRSSQEDDLGPDVQIEFERRVAEAVRLRLTSDVPVGTLLSGGIDSTLVTTLARDECGPSIPAFTMGFDDPDFDEAPVARSIAAELGGNHREFQMNTTSAGDVFDSMWEAYDEPFADSSAIPTLDLARNVARSVKVALTGDGGDETHCGYQWHEALNRLDPLGHSDIPADKRHQGLVYFKRWHRIPDERPIDRAGIWTALRTGLSDEMLPLLPVAAYGRQPLSEYFREWSSGLSSTRDCFAWAGQMDLLTYVPDDLMVKTDRAAMSVGLELREPLLDHELTQWLLALPASKRFDQLSRTTKVLPRRALAGRISPGLLDGPKRGFSPPAARWLAGPLAGRMADALRRLERGELDPIGLPEGCRGWGDTDPLLHDANAGFLWRILCFSEWTRNASNR